MKKVKCALIGHGNIGTGLLGKLQRGAVLESVPVVGIDPDSDGLKRVRGWGVKTSAECVDVLSPYVKLDGVWIAFDATGACVDAGNAPKIDALGVMTIDLTSVAIGPVRASPLMAEDTALTMARDRSGAVRQAA